MPVVFFSEVACVRPKKNVRPRLGKAVELAKGKDCPSKMQTKTPGMFSLNSIAFGGRHQQAIWQALLSNHEN